MSGYPARASAISATVSAWNTSVRRQQCMFEERLASPISPGDNFMPNYYPIMLDIRGRLAIVVGGDRVAAEKATALSASGARVQVMSQEFCDELFLLQAEQRSITLHQKAYEPGDLAGAFVVIAAI